MSDKALPTLADKQGMAVHWLFVTSIIATLAVFALSDWEHPYFTWSRILTIFVFQILVITHPLLWSLRLYRTYRDFMHPAVFGSLTFLIFHIFFNPIAITDVNVLQMRGFILSEWSGFIDSIMLSYILIAVSWFSYCLGLSWGHYRVQVRPTPEMRSPPLTCAFLFVGLGYIAVGIIGNAAVLGGLSEYILKMLHFYERSQMREIANLFGGTKFTIMQKFLPPGLVLLALGFWVYRKGSNVMLIVMLSLASFSNVLLSCATGGRGSFLKVFFYSIPLFNAYIKRLTLKTFILFSGGLIAVSFILGGLRSASEYGDLNSNLISGLVWNMDKFVGFIARYLTNFVGTMTLVDQVRVNGVSWGQTAFSGLTGLLGGTTPLTTQGEVWWRIAGKFSAVNPRYGPPGELFFNFGWLGVIIGMALIGYCVGRLGKVYTHSISERSVRGGMMIIFASFTANFLIIGNLQYLPPYFIFFLTPFYFVFFYFRHRRC